MAEETVTNTGNAVENTAATETTGTENKSESTVLTTEAIEKIIQSRVDKASADLGKKIASLQKENESLKKANMTAEELRKHEADERDKTLAERERALQDKENRWYAMKAIKEIGLDDGGNNSLALVDFVMADDENGINERVKAFSELVNKFVAAKVDEKFKAIGRTPNGAAAVTETKKDSSIAAQIGQRRAEQAKKSNDILNMYLGGKK